MSFHKGQRVQVTARAHANGVLKKGSQTGVITGVGEYIYVLKDGQKSASCYSRNFWEPITMSETETIYPGCVTLTCKACGAVEPIVRSDGTTETDLERAAMAYVLNKPDSRAKLELAALQINGPAFDRLTAERDEARARVEDLGAKLVLSVKQRLDEREIARQQRVQLASERDQAVADLLAHDQGHCGQDLTAEIKRREAAEERADDVKDRIKALEESLREACRQITTYARAVDYDEASAVADKLVEVADE